MITIEQLKDLQNRADALHKYLDIENKQIELHEVELRTQDPAFWENQKEAEKVMKQLREIRSWVEGYKSVRSSLEDLEVLFDFAKMGEASEDEVDGVLSGKRRYFLRLF